MSSEKFTAAEVVTALNNSMGMVYVAARGLGCTANTIYNYAKRYKSVQDAIDAQRGMMIDTAELALVKAIKNGEGWAISLALKTIGKQRGYVERSEVVNFNVDTALVKQAIEAMEAAGLNASDVFNDIVREASELQTIRAGGDPQATDEG